MEELSISVQVVKEAVGLFSWQVSGPAEEVIVRGAIRYSSQEAASQGAADTLSLLSDCFSTHTQEEQSEKEAALDEPGDSVPGHPKLDEIPCPACAEAPVAPPNLVRMNNKSEFMYLVYKDQNTDSHGWVIGERRPDGSTVWIDESITPYAGSRYAHLAAKKEVDLLNEALAEVESKA